MHHPTPMTLAIPAALALLPILCAYLVTGCFGNGRSTPPIFFALSLLLASLAFFPARMLVALLASLLAGISALVLALDQIHGECWYPVLEGETSWHKARLGEYLWYRQCQQPALAFWLMLVLLVIWLAISSYCAYTQYTTQKRSRVALEEGDDEQLLQ